MLLLCTLLQVSGSKGTAAAAFPASLWAQILQHVPQQQRLTQAALVCRAWAPAASQATVHVDQNIDSQAAQAMQSWLAVHADQLLSLKLTALYERQYMQLPMSKLTRLQSLQLQGCSVQLPLEGGTPSTNPCAGSGDSSRWCSSSHTGPGLPSLQHMELTDVELADISSLLQLTRAPQLTSLILDGIDLRRLNFSSVLPDECQIGRVFGVAQATHRMLQQLPQLSILQLPGFPFSCEAVQTTAAMTQLQQLCINTKFNSTSSLQDLPSSITQLQLHGELGKYGKLDLPAELSQLSGLRQLYLEHCWVPPMVLGSVTQLQALHLTECRLLTIDPATEAMSESTTTLLDVLPKLTSLQDFRMQGDGLDIDSIAPQRFAALTASSHLTQLSLVCDVEMCLPQGAVQCSTCSRPAGRCSSCSASPSAQTLAVTLRMTSGASSGASTAMISSVLSAAARSWSH
jgi:hypothetical protein